MSLPRYPEYRDSGVEWLGAVPVHWELSPLKHLADFFNGCVFKPGSWSEAGTPIIRIENLNGSRTFNYYDGDVDLRHHVREGDLLFGWSGNRGTSFGPFIWPLPGSFFLNQHIFKVVPRNCDVRWLFWCLRAVTTHVEDQATGIIGMVHVTKGDLGAIKVPLPPVDEQRSQVAFLDRETAKIDALIAEQEKLLALLAEKRQATISHAVTRGLDPNAPMKDSGIPWLGEVPAHWEVRSLKSIVATPITDGPHETPDFLDEGVPFISAEAVSGGTINFDKIRGHISADDDARYSQKYRPQLHDIYMVKSGATTGVTAIVDGRTDFNIWSPLAAIRCSQAIAHPYFILSYLRSRNFQEGVALNWSFGTQQNIGMGVLGDLPVALPPKDEQREISRFLEDQLRALSTLQLSAQQAVPLLRERRNALIAAAVTGQIDVRDLVQAQAA